MTPPLGLDMLGDTLIQGPGDFAARGAWPAVGILAALLAGTVASGVRPARA